MTGNCDPHWDKDFPEVHVVPGWAPDPRSLAPAQLSFPLDVLLSLPGLCEAGFGSQAGDDTLPWDPPRGYFGATLNMQVKGSSCIWKPVDASIQGSAVCHSVPACILSLPPTCHNTGRCQGERPLPAVMAYAFLQRLPPPPPNVSIREGRVPTARLLPAGHRAQNSQVYVRKLKSVIASSSNNGVGNMT